VTAHVIEMTPIGTVRCPATTVADVPSEGLPSDVVLDPQYLPALRGIEVGDDLYVLAYFDRADGRVLAGSAGTQHEQGAFSIRSSSRPNRLGMTLARVTAIDGCMLSFDWLDFADGSPVLDLKRYNWRWECLLATRRLDRRFIERQIDRSALAAVLARAAAGLHGERCAWVQHAGELAARLIQERDVWLGSPTLHVGVHGDGHLLEAVQGISGASHGNGRLSVRWTDSGQSSIQLTGDVELTATWIDGWHIG
jgi:tRNA (Thr-GGU) A37 N-methylase